jgi:hypothetical protein
MQQNLSTPLRERINVTVRDIPRSGIRDFFDIVSTMKDVISLGIGEPDFDTPWHVHDHHFLHALLGQHAFQDFPHRCRFIEHRHHDAQTGQRKRPNRRFQRLGIAGLHRWRSSAHKRSPFYWRSSPLFLRLEHTLLPRNPM